MSARRATILGPDAARWTRLRTPVDDLDHAFFDELLEPGIFGVPGRDLSGFARTEM